MMVLEKVNYDLSLKLQPLYQPTVMGVGNWLAFVCCVLQSHDHGLWFSQPTSDKQILLGKPDSFKNAVFT